MNTPYPDYDRRPQVEAKGLAHRFATALSPFGPNHSSVFRRFALRSTCAALWTAVTIYAISLWMPS